LAVVDDVADQADAFGFLSPKVPAGEQDFRGLGVRNLRCYTTVTVALVVAWLPPKSVTVSSMSSLVPVAKRT
jgi:hypothetical protein